MEVTVKDSPTFYIELDKEEALNLATLLHCVTSDAMRELLHNKNYFKSYQEVLEAIITLQNKLFNYIDYSLIKKS